MKSKSLSRILKEPSVVFDDGEHTYKRKDNGELYTGCTTISDAWDKSFFLGPWYAKEMANFILGRKYDEVHSFDPYEFECFINEAKGAAKRKSEQAKIDGTAAHDWIASGIAAKLNPENKLLPMPEGDEAKNAVNAFIKWAKKNDITWLASEEVVCSDEHRIGGKLDAIANIDGIPTIIDFKTSGQVSESAFVQLAGYAIMLEEMGFVPRQWMVVRIPKDGGKAEDVLISDLKEMDFYRQTFLHLRQAHKFFVYVSSHKKDERGKIITNKDEEGINGNIGNPVKNVGGAPGPSQSDAGKEAQAGDNRENKVLDSNEGSGKKEGGGEQGGRAIKNQKVGQKLHTVRKTIRNKS